MLLININEGNEMKRNVILLIFIVVSDFLYSSIAYYKSGNDGGE